MSTRCNIILKDDEHQVILYHHCDGYPEGVGSFLYRKVNDNLKKGRFCFAEDIANYLLKDEEDNSYELTSGIHGDIEYLYEIDTHNKTLKCWKYDGWNGKKVKEIYLSKINEEA